MSRICLERDTRSGRVDESQFVISLTLTSYIKMLKSKIPLSQKVAEREVRDEFNGSAAGESSSTATMSPILSEEKRETSQMAFGMSSAETVTTGTDISNAFFSVAVTAGAVSKGIAPESFTSDASAPVRKEHKGVPSQR